MKKAVPTIRDVAAAAHVSIATVSKYVNGAQRFSPAVESALDAAIAALGYRSNPLARAMITGRSDAIGLVVDDIADPHAARIAKGAADAAGARGIALLLGATAAALLARVDGLLVLPHAGALAPVQAPMDKPTVAVDCVAAGALATVACDAHAGAAMLARHLLLLGHRRIAYLGVAGSSDDAARLDGLRAGLHGAGLPLTAFEATAATAAEGARLCAAIVLGAGAPDALVCHDDMMALGVMAEAARLGVSVPRDLSVAGFGNHPCGRYATPALTTVDTQPERMGALALETLLAALGGAAVERRTLLAPQPLARASTAARAA